MKPMARSFPQCEEQLTAQIGFNELHLEEGRLGDIRILQAEYQKCNNRGTHCLDANHPGTAPHDVASARF